jgi:ABC-type dipeptide/oligopeptide/nickel transport system permease component
MIWYAIRRFLLAIVVIVLVSAIVFLMVRLLPGDPVLMVVSRSQIGTMTPEQIAQTRHE